MANQGLGVSLVEAGVHAPAIALRHADRVLSVHELIVVQSGALPIAEEDARFAVRRNQWVLLQAGHRHHGYDDLDDDTWFYWVCFGSRDAEGILASVRRGRQIGSVARPDRARILFEHMLVDQQASILSAGAARSYLQLLFAEILLEPAGAASSTASHTAQRAAAFIADHITEPGLSTGLIARALSCNADYLGRTFREGFAETPTEHIHRLRVDRACMLFRSTSRSVERVAVDVGFVDARYFRRVFRRCVGLTPAQFQRLRPAISAPDP
jgi:AraC-like DNA-binding protein